MALIGEAYSNHGSVTALELNPLNVFGNILDNSISEKTDLRHVTYLTARQQQSFNNLMECNDLVAKEVI